MICFICDRTDAHTLKASEHMKEWHGCTDLNTTACTHNHAYLTHITTHLYVVEQLVGSISGVSCLHERAQAADGPLHALQ